MAKKHLHQRVATEVAVSPHDNATEPSSPGRTCRADKACQVHHVRATEPVSDRHAASANSGIMPHDRATGASAVHQADDPEAAGAPNPAAILRTLSAEYRAATRTAKGRLLDDFVRRTGYHRKHAIRLLLRQCAPEPRPPYFDDRVRDALVVVWEATGRVGSTRLKALIPELVPAMVRQGRLSADTIVRSKLLGASTATIDRLLGPVRGRTQAEVLEHRLKTISEAIKTLANFSIPADLPSHERHRLEALSSSLMQDAQRSFDSSIRRLDVRPGLPRSSAAGNGLPPETPITRANRHARSNQISRRRKWKQIPAPERVCLQSRNSRARPSS